MSVRGFDADRFRVVIVGHSFVSRLQAFVRNEGQSNGMKNLRLDPDRYEISFLGIPGASTRGNRSLQPALQQIDAIHPDFVLIEIGSNDPCDENVEPRRLAGDIISLARFVSVGYDTPCVVVGSILPRVGARWLAYNQRVAAANRYLSELIAAESGIHYWRHRGFTCRSVNPLAEDGVHPNAAHGMPKYVRSVRQAVLFFHFKSKQLL
jgi:lysophospholipase L1-like esterase